MTPAEHVTIFLLRLFAAAARVAPSLTGQLVHALAAQTAWYYLTVEALYIEDGACSS
jgi:hypothetical protein